MLYLINTISFYLLAIFSVGLVFFVFITAMVNIISGVPYVPTRQKYVKNIIKLLDLKEGEKVYDLGCGDGRFLSEASKITKTKAIGYETAPIPFFLAKLRQLFSTSKFDVLMKNFYNTSFEQANVIYCYLGPETMQKLAPKFQKECKKGTRIYSNSFSIKSIKPKQTWKKNGTIPNLFLYEI